MAYQFLDTISLSNSKSTLDNRQYWATLDELKANTDILMPKGFIAYAADKDKWYKLSCTDAADPSTYVWNLFGGGSSDDIKYTGKAGIDVGGIKAGTVYTEESLTKVIDDLINPYLKPVVVLTISPTTTLYEKGTTVKNLKMSIAATKKSKDITKIEFLKGEDVIATITEGVAEGGTYTFDVEDFDTDADFYGKAYDDGNESISGKVSVKFAHASYYGVVDSNNVTSFDDLTKAVVGVKGYTVKGVNATNQYFAYAYPASFGDITSLIDQNNMQIFTSLQKSTITVGEVEYNVYTFKDTFSVTGGKLVFA